MAAAAAAATDSLCAERDARPGICVSVIEQQQQRKKRSKTRVAINFVCVIV
jgi:hypothetical protein